MAPIVITQAELLDALAAASASKGPEAARTVPEMAALSGLSVKRIREALRQYQAQGRLEVHRVSRPALDGRASIVPAYTITPVVAPVAPVPKRRR